MKQLKRLPKSLANQSVPKTSTPSLQESFKAYPSTEAESQVPLNFLASEERQRQLARKHCYELVISFPWIHQQQNRR